MIKNLKEESIFPVDKNDVESEKQLSAKLSKISKDQHANEAENVEPQTLGDDFDLLPEQLNVIEQTEKEMRELLAHFDVSYDRLIAMDGQSVYSRAVAANPAILTAVKEATNPVYAAVKIALQFKPYADFMEKYGSEPNEILSNIKQAEKAEFSPRESGVNSPSFSSTKMAKKMEEKVSKTPSLDDIFKR